MKTAFEIFGWYGTAAIVLAYALVSFGYLSPASLAYQVLNGTGALGVAAISLYRRTYQPGILNIIWTIIALLAIARVLSLS
ncbi:MAG TPA: hypothetical protein VFQ72_01380 [Candidatus Paceibacterota bacterium]|nr:hypothetical protein [Candidatus Paceibacterota bacterium]